MSGYRLSGCPTLIHWAKKGVIPLHQIAREILLCNSDKIYYVDYGDEFQGHNIVIGAENVEDVVNWHMENH